MPWGDRRGPWGRGPRTGRGLGYCSGNDRPGFMEPGPGMGYRRGWGRGWGRGRGFGWGRGRGFGWGRGGGRGWGRGFGWGRGWGRGSTPDIEYPYYDDPDYYQRTPYYDEGYRDNPGNPDDEKEYLKGYLEELEAEVAEVKKRLSSINKK